MKLQLIVLSLLLRATVFSQNTNETYLVEESSSSSWLNHDEKIAFNAKAQQDADKAGECLPAECDPVGHWGKVYGGIQLCLRSETNVFVAGQPMPISIIVRNVSTNPIPIARWSEWGETQLVIETESGQEIRPGGISRSFYGYADLAPKHQVKYRNFLSIFSKYEPGRTYKVRVEPMGVFYDRDLGKMIYQTNLCSGTLVFKVVSP